MRFALFRRVATDPVHLELHHAGQRFEIALRRRPTAKRITLRVSNATGDIVLTLPERTDLKTAQRFAESHGAWIAGRVAKVPERVSFEHGASIPLRGVSHQIMHWTSVRGATQATRASDGRPIIAVCGEAPHVARRVREFLEAEANKELRAAVQRHAMKLGILPKRITIRDTTTRWGSCSSSGALSFSWRLILAPPYILDYLAAHEVAHLKELNHSHRFWKIVHGLCAKTEEAEIWLKRHGGELHRFG